MDVYDRIQADEEEKKRFVFMPPHRMGEFPE